MFKQMDMKWMEIPKDLKMEDIPSKSEDEIKEMISKLPEGIAPFVRSLEINLTPEEMKDITERDVMDAFLMFVQSTAVCGWYCPVVLYRDGRTLYSIQFLYREYVKFEIKRLNKVVLDVIDAGTST